LLDCFIGGLILELRHEVISRAPHSSLQAVSFAKLFEENFHPSSLAPKHKFPYFHAKSLIQNTSKLSLTANSNPPPLLPTPSKPNNLKRLTLVDIQSRREKGICLTCDEKYSPTHQSANKHYFLSRTQMYKASRLYKVRHLIYHTIPQWEAWLDSQDLITNDPYREFSSAAGPNSKLQHKQGFWLWEGRLLIPATSTIWHMILKEFHDSLVCGHAGTKRTLARIAAQFLLERDSSRWATICERLYKLSTS